MPRYLVERTFTEHNTLPGPEQDERARKAFFKNNAQDGVIWVHSYLAPDGKKSFCIYEAPNPEAIRRAALRNRLPVDRISEVSILDPYLLGKP